MPRKTVYTRSNIYDSGKCVITNTMEDPTEDKRYPFCRSVSQDFYPNDPDADQKVRSVAKNDWQAE